MVNDDFPIETDAIIGRNFLSNHLCKLDYETFTITICLGQTEVTLPMLTKLSKYENIHIPARTQIITPINFKVEEDSVILNDEIINGVFIANSIMPTKGIPHIKIVNTLERDVKITNFSPKIIPLKNFEILQSRKYKTNEERYKRLLKEINLENLDQISANTLKPILKEFADIFHLNDDILSVNNFYKQQISLNDPSPVYIKNYRLPESQRDEINKQVEKLIDEKLIEASTSPYNSPLLLVPKKSLDGEKKWRLVVDFRQLNKKIVDDKFPLTRLDDILDNLGRSKYFSTLDLTSSFHQIELHPDSRHLTAFSTNKGHYQFKRLPFGLKISTNSFQRMLSIALAGLDTEAFLYVDDIIIFGCSINHHNSNLIKIFQRLRKYNLKVNPTKCNFLRKEVTYLGHLITDEGIKTDPLKYEVIKNYPTPANADEIKRFVAFCNYYRRFIPDFAKTAKPLNTVTKKNVKFEWTTECQNAFDELKTKLMNPPILAYPNFQKEFIITTDASDYALGAVLSQGEAGNDLPISYASRTLNKFELNKPPIEKELLAVHWAINFFRPYIYGKKFTVVTDHRPLISLFSHTNPSPKLTRIRIDLADYDFTVQYKQGKLNVNADALSRIKIDTETLKAMIPMNINVLTRRMTKEMEIKKNIEQDKEIKEQITQEPDQLHCWNCTSLSEVNKMKKLQFVQIKNDASNKKSTTREHIKKKILKGRSVTFDDKPYINLGNISEKSNGNENTYTSSIKMHKNKIYFEFSENPNLHLDEILEKLIFAMKNKNIEKVALASEDDIFKFVDINQFKMKYNKLQQNKKEKLKILLYKSPKRILKNEEMLKLISEYHESPHTGGHSGVKRTLSKLKQKYVWKNMNKMVKNHVNKCTKCAKNKQVKHTKENMMITDTPNKTFETISIDTVGPLRISNNYRYILTLQCELSKYVEAFPLETKEAISIAKVLVEKFILKYGAFKNLKSDLGTEFVNEIIKNICKLFNINHVKSTPFHHETLGSIERNHRVLNEYLMSFMHDFNWVEWIPYFTFCYNTTPHVETGYSPFELVYGRLADKPNENLLQIEINSRDISQYEKELRYRLKYACDKSKELLELRKIERKKEFDKKVNPLALKFGDLVWMKVGNKKKLEPPYKGPFEVIGTEGVNSIIKIGDKIKTVHNNLLKLHKQ